MSWKQRTAERIEVNLNARWQSCFEQREGNVADISTGGCFILTSGDVTRMELIELELELPTERWVRLWGQVVYHIEEMGFAVRFAAGGGDEDMSLLKGFIESARVGGDYRPHEVDARSMQAVAAE